MRLCFLFAKTAFYCLARSPLLLRHKTAAAAIFEQTAAKVFMIISCVLYALLGIIMMTVAFWVGIIYWIPLCWVVPMTVVYNNSINGMRPPVGLAFKICALLFASLITGILMLCDNNN